jgi:anaerobic selenocysteine-containing dehydrogenase
MAERRLHGFCALCRSRCGAIAVTEGDRLLRIEPDPDHPTGESLCIKGKAGVEILYNPNRQLHPLRRTNPKGSADPGWRRITWDEALDSVAARLAGIRAETGAESVAFSVTSPSATPISDGLPFIMRLVNRFGTPNLCNATEVCNWHKDHAHRFTFGQAIGSPDFARAETILLWGYNPSTAWLDHATATAAARRRGAAIIVVDPRRAGFAHGADLWLRVRPGTDAALALGIAHAMIAQGGVDRAFLARWSNGPLLVRADTGEFLRARDIDPSLPEAWLVASDAGGGRLFHDPARVAIDPAVAPSLDYRGRMGGVDCASAFTLYRERCAAYTPGRVEQITGVPAADIARAADLLTHRRPVSHYSWTGVGQHSNATQTDRAIATLMALTGSIGSPGGNVNFGAPPVAGIDGSQFLPPEQAAKVIGRATRPIGPTRWGGGILAQDLYASILDGTPYRTRALVNFGSNLLVTRADPTRGAAALAALEFHVHLNPVMTPTARDADIFLPVNTQWEREGLRAGFEVDERAASLVQLRQAAVPTAGESRSDTWIVFELARRLGFDADFWHGDVEAAWNEMLAPAGLTASALREHPEGISVPITASPYQRHAEKGFDTETRLVELYSALLARHGASPLPEPGPETQDAEHPLWLTSAKVPHYCHSQHRDIPSLRRRLPDPSLDIHPQTARARGIGEGDWLEVRSPAGRCRLKARFDEALAPDVVCASYGWSDDGSNAVFLTDNVHCDPVSGSPRQRGVPCEVARAG